MTTGIERAIAQAGSAKALADAVGVGEPAVSKWRKRGYVSMDQIDRVAALFGVPTWELCSPRLARMLGRR